MYQSIHSKQVFNRKSIIVFCDEDFWLSKTPRNSLGKEIHVKFSSITLSRLANGFKQAKRNGRKEIPSTSSTFGEKKKKVIFLESLPVVFVLLMKSEDSSTCEQLDKWDNTWEKLPSFGHVENVVVLQWNERENSWDKEDHYKPKHT